MQKQNYIATAICDGVKKHFTVQNVTEGRATSVAKSVGRSLFYATCVSVLSLTLMK